MRRALMLLVASVALTCVMPTQVAADLVPGIMPLPPPAKRASNASGTPTVVLYDSAGQEIARKPRRWSGGGSASDWSCGYYEQSSNAGYAPAPNLSRRAEALVDGQYYWLLCVDQDANQVYVAHVLWDPTNPLGPVEAGWRAADLAEAQIPLPDPAVRTNPPAAQAQLVGLATWLWLDDPWEPRTATATLAGVGATVTATPVEVRWDPGDGEPSFACPDAGTPYDPDHPDRAPPCSHVYHQRSTVDSPAATYPLTATVTWRVDWRSTDGDGGSLPDLTRRTTVPVLVHEAQALIE